MSIAEVLAGARYRTLQIGKWHLNGPTPDPTSDPGWVAPEDRQGFDRWVAFNCAHIYYDGKYYADGDPVVRQIPAGVYEPDFQTDQAIQFITANRLSRFCVFLSYGPRTHIRPGSTCRPEATTISPTIQTRSPCAPTSITPMSRRHARSMQITTESRATSTGTWGA